jgi:hypothetical protein
VVASRSSGWIVTRSHAIPMLGSSLIFTVPATAHSLSVDPAGVTVTE